MPAFVDSKHKKISPEEIIAIAAEKTGGKYSADQIKASVAMEIHKSKAWVMRENNTLFIINAVPNQSTIAVFRALNGDTIPNYLKNSVMFTEAMGRAGFKYLVTRFSDKSLLNIFEYVRRNAPFEGMGYAVQQLQNGDYKVTVNLGNPGSKRKGAK
jgi:hypothetical protein